MLNKQTPGGEKKVGPKSSS